MEGGNAGSVDVEEAKKRGRVWGASRFIGKFGGFACLVIWEGVILQASTWKERCLAVLLLRRQELIGSTEQVGDEGGVVECWFLLI